MNKYDELVKALRHCHYGLCEECVREMKCRDTFLYGNSIMDGLHKDAAAAIEALQAEQKKTVTQIFGEEQMAWEGRCKDLLYQIENLQSQLPKLGEWIPIQIGKWRGHKCSCCGTAREVPCSSSDGIPQWKYCPECGARMNGGKDDI